MPKVSTWRVTVGLPFNIAEVLVISDVNAARTDEANGDGPATKVTYEQAN